MVDGAWRDIPDLQALNFPVFGRGICPVSRPKSQLGEINVPICCGGVVVNAGDLIMADAEGIVVVPRAEATSVVFTAAGGVAMDWDEDKQALRRDG